MGVGVGGDGFETQLDTTVDTSLQMTNETVVNGENITVVQVPAEASHPNTAEGDMVALNT
ncbi:hypothetical protein PF008_g12289 [Phytophthora fragariae]|nr:hypothetical protein PF008_g12289 [Phytophthora fragariae]